MDSGIGSFFKLIEVGFSPYLGFIPIFSTFRMFRLIEALNGRLIGPKALDRIDLIYGTQCEQPITVRGCLGLSWLKLGFKSWIDLDEAGNGREMRVHKVNR